MTAHGEIYSKFFSICRDDRPPCERCAMLALSGLAPVEEGIREAVDIHHCSARGMGGDPAGGADRIENLGGVCRMCHGILESVPQENDLFAKWCELVAVRKIVMQKFAFGCGEEFIREVLKDRATSLRSP